ncbi:MAG: YceI family protein [Crocinitomicaceae bacterium]|nr:YceI family protein [Crocinitomicaceae bacterium]
MIKKIAIIGGVLAVVTVVIIFAVPWGSYESTLEKTELTDTVDYNNEENGESTPSLDSLEGSYTVKVKNSKGGNAEILFHTDGLKSTKGGFEDFSITFEVPDNFKKSELTVKIKTASVNTGNDTRDEHLQEEGFFHSSKYPEIIFQSNEIILGDTSYVAKGELTLNGSTKELEVPFHHLGAGGEKKNRFEAFEGAFEIDRTAYGQDESTGVGNIVKINFYCELKRQ